MSIRNYFVSAILVLSVTFVPFPLRAHEMGEAIAEIQQVDRPVDTQIDKVDKFRVMSLVTVSAAANLPRTSEFVQTLVSVFGKLDNLEGLVVQAADKLVELKNLEELKNELYFDSIVNDAFHKGKVTKDILKTKSASALERMKQKKEMTSLWNAIKFIIQTVPSEQSIPEFEEEIMMQQLDENIPQIEGPTISSVTNLKEVMEKDHMQIRESAVMPEVDPEVAGLVAQLKSLNQQIDALISELWSTTPEYFIQVAPKTFARLLAYDIFNSLRLKMGRKALTDVAWLFTQPFCNYDYVRDKIPMYYILKVIDGDVSGAVADLARWDRNLACLSQLQLMLTDLYFYEVYNEMTNKIAAFGLTELHRVKAALTFNLILTLFDEVKSFGSGQLTILTQDKVIFAGLDDFVNQFGLWLRYRDAVVSEGSDPEGNMPPGGLAQVNFDTAGGTSLQIPEEDIHSSLETEKTPFGLDPEIIAQRFCGKELMGPDTLRTLPNAMNNITDPERLGFGLQGLWDTFWMPDTKGICGYGGGVGGGGGGASISCTADTGGGLRVCLPFAPTEAISPMELGQFPEPGQAPETTQVPLYLVTQVLVGTGCGPGAGDPIPPEGGYEPGFEPLTSTTEQKANEFTANIKLRDKKFQNEVKKKLEKGGWPISDENAKTVEKAFENGSVTVGDLPTGKKATIKTYFDDQGNVIKTDIVIGTDVASDYDQTLEKLAHEMGHAYMKQQYTGTGKHFQGGYWKEGAVTAIEHKALSESGLYGNHRPGPDEYLGSCTASGSYSSRIETCSRETSGGQPVNTLFAMAEGPEPYMPDPGEPPSPGGPLPPPGPGPVSDVGMVGMYPDPEKAVPAVSGHCEVLGTYQGMAYDPMVLINPGWLLKIDDTILEEQFINVKQYVEFIKYARTPEWLVLISQGAEEL